MTDRLGAMRPLRRLMSLCAAALVLLGACGDSGQTDASGAIARALLATEEQRYREAIIELRNAVAIEPNNAQARFQLGAAALTLGDAQTAQKELRRAQAMAYDVQTLLPLLAQALLLSGRANEALAELRDAPAQSAEVLALTGLAYEAQGEIDDALGAYQQALALDPTEERALLGLGRSTLSKADREGARQAFEKAVAAHGDSPPVRLEYGRYLYGLGRAADAAVQYESALAQPLVEEHLPLRWELSLALAEAQLAIGQLAQADATIDTLNELQPDHMLVKYLRARAAFERKDLTAANDLVERVLVEAPTFVAGQVLQATLHLTRSEYGLATALLERMVQLNPNDSQVRTLLAAARRAGETRPTAQDQPIPLGDPDVLSLLGAANAQTGDYDAAVGLWERVLQEHPEDGETRLELASAYLLRGRMDDAEAQLDAMAWEQPAQAERAAVLGTLLSLRRQDLASARDQAAAAAKRFPESATVVSLQGLIALGQEDTAGASRYFQRALEMDPGHSVSVVNLAKIAAAAGDRQGALSMLSTFVETNARDAGPLDALARLQLQGGDRKGARANLERARFADPTAVAPRRLLVALLTRDGDYARGELVAREVVALRPSAAHAHDALGVALVGQGKLDEGMASLRTALRMDPTALAPLRNLARAEYASSQLTQARQSIEQLLRTRPNDVVGLDLATRLAIDEGRADQAQALLARLVQANPEGTRALKLVLSGDIAMLRGQHEEALRAYEEVFPERPSTTMVMRLYKARTRSGGEQPQQVLRDWLEQHPDDRTVRMAAALHAHSAGDLVAASLDYEHLLRLDRRDPVLWNNLAWAYSALGDFRALDTSRRALELASDSPAIQDTYGWMLVLDGQLENGIAMLRAAWDAAPQAGEIGYHLAAGLARAGATDEARSVLGRALATEGTFSARPEAEQLMESL